MNKRRTQQHEIPTSAAPVADVDLADLALTLHTLEQQLNDSRTLAALGAEPREFRYALASFRQRYAAVWKLTGQGVDHAEPGRHQDTR